MLQRLVETMHGRRVTQDNPFKKKVHTMRMHQFFYGFTMIEALISLSLMSLFIIPLVHVKIKESELDLRMRFKVELYKRNVSCVNNVLLLDESPHGSSCEILDGGLKIMYEDHVIYYVKP